MTKRSFKTTNSGYLVSRLVPKETEDHLTIGLRLTTTRPLVIDANLTIPPGERGSVAWIGPDGELEILLDNHFCALHRWNNRLYLEPFVSDDILSGIMCVYAIERRYGTC
jgi:hypothetical protein